MEPPPGPRSSPPGPRPVPPPRKGSMERRPLSPPHRGGEHWDVASDASARASKPGTPERPAVTQRVLIVMQSHGGPPPAVPRQGPESAPILSRGASPPESAPILSRGASPPESAPIPSHRASPPEGTPILSCGASQGRQDMSSPPPSTPIPSRGSSQGDWDKTAPECASIMNRGASQGSQEKMALESTPIPSWGPSLPPSSTILSWGASPPSAPMLSWGASQGDQKTSPPESTPIQSWGASLPPRMCTRDQETSPPESALITRMATPPPSTSIQNLGASRRTSPPESTLITCVATSELEHTATTPVQDQGAPPSQETPRTHGGETFHGPTPIRSIPRENHRVSASENVPVTSGGLPSNAILQDWGAPASMPVPNQQMALQHSATQDQVESPPEDIERRRRLPQADMLGHTVGAPPNCIRAQDYTTTHDCVSSPKHGTPMPQGRSIEANNITLNVCETSVTLTDGASPSVTPSQSCTASDMQSAATARPEEAKSAATAVPEEAKSAATAVPEEARSCATAVPEEARSCATAVPEEARSCATAVPEEARSCATAVPEEARSCATAVPEEARSAATAVPEEARSAATARPEEARSAATARPEEAKSAATARPEEAKSAATARPEEAKSAATARPEEAKSAATARPEEAKSAATARPEEAKSAATARPEEAKSAATARPEEAKSAATARPEEIPAAAQSITTITTNVIMQHEVPQKQDGSPVAGNITQTQVNPTSQSQTSNLPVQPSLGWSLSPIRLPDPASPHRSMSSKPPLPIPPRSNLYPSHPLREQETSATHETISLSSIKSKAPAPDTLSYLDSVSLMSGTMESLTLLDDASSIGSDSEINGMPYRKTDKYGFLGGNQYSGNGETMIPVEIARQRELKWLEMFSNWDKWLTRRSQKVKLRCRKGIPSSLRAKAWQFLSNSHELLIKNPGKFEEIDRQLGDPKWLDVIEKDLHRQFPFHEMFAARGGHGQQDLYRILKAYTVYRPEEGYCQAQAPVAAVLLMHMPAEQAFWCLVQICDKYLPGYYSAGLEAIQLDGEIFFALLRRICPMAYRHLKKFKIDPILYMTEWFMCIFSRTLPWASVLRVWDMFFCEGVKIIFRVGLVLLRHTLGSVDKLRSCQGMYETMEKLRSLPVHCMQEEVLLPEVSSLPVTDALIDRESNTQLRKWRENRGELQYRPSRRLHGARQIYEESVRLNPNLSGSRLSLSSIRRPSPPATPMLAVQPESMVVSEGLRPALPSPTSNKAPLGPPKELPKKGKEKQREQEKKREREDREREKKREKEEREERRKEKDREKQREKEEKRVQKERDKADTRQKKERKFSFRRKESSAPESPRNSGPGATEGTAAHDTYF